MTCKASKPFSRSFWTCGSHVQLADRCVRRRRVCVAALSGMATSEARSLRLLFGGTTALLAPRSAAALGERALALPSELTSVLVRLSRERINASCCTCAFAISSTRARTLLLRPGSVDGGGDARGAAAGALVCSVSVVSCKRSTFGENIASMRWWRRARGRSVVRARWSGWQVVSTSLAGVRRERGEQLLSSWVV